MHIEIDEYNPLFEVFNSKRIALGYTTCKAAMMEAMKLFVEKPTPSYISSKEQGSSDNDSNA